MSEHTIKMKYLFSHAMKLIYPRGCSDKHHWRDVCKIYFMGYIDALQKNGPDEVAKLIISDCKMMVDFNWWPDNSWKWW